MRHEKDLSRRDFLIRAGGAAVALPTMAAILDACTKPGRRTGSDPPGSRSHAPTTP